MGQSQSSHVDVAQGTERLETSQSSIPELLIQNHHEETEIQECSCASHRDKREDVGARWRSSMHQCPDPSGHSVLDSGTMFNHKDHGGDQATTSRVLGDTIVEHTHTFQRDAERRILRGAWHRIVRRRRKKRQIARRGPPEQRRARTDGQVKTQQVSSKSGQSAFRTSQQTRRTLCHHALLE